MRILHYALGFPPYRSGGLTKFCIDLMIQQQKDGSEVALLWPGQMRLMNRSIEIKDRGKYYCSNTDLNSFELINPLPISFDEGINDFEAFTLKSDKEIYKFFLRMYNPDVVHVHTLMGIHKEFFEAAKDLKIRLVFTAHDFFPICPKVTMFRHNQICECVFDCKECSLCNSTALSVKKIYLLQSPLYRKLKDSTIFKKLRKSHRDNYLNERNSENESGRVGFAEDYIKLRNYYYSMLKMMDMIHYNSTITKSVYDKYFDLPNNVIIPVSHGDIKDCRKTKEYNHEILRIRYLGPQSAAKGYFLLKDALDSLWNIRKDFILDIHFEPNEKSEYMRIHDRYNYAELEKIFEETDVLVVPSIWYETFGFTVIEALSYGVPTIVSNNVGAKDILEDQFGIIIKNFDANNLKCFIESLSAKELNELNKNICLNYDLYTIGNMTEDLFFKCYMLGE